MRGFWSIFFIFFIFTSPAQDKQGIVNSNYSSTNSIFLNPSSSADSRTFFQLNWLGINAFVQTNQAHLPNFIIRKKYFETTPNPIIKTNKQKAYVYSNIGFEGTTAVLSTENIGIGTFVRVRAIVDVRNIPFNLIKAIAEEDSVYLAQRLEIDIRNVKLSEMTWAEYGINFSKLIRKSGFEIVSVGGNLKYLTGINIAYANLNEFKSVFKDTTVAIENYSAKARVNKPGWDTGKGMGLDIGITYKKMSDWVDSYHPNSKKSHCKYVDYKYKIGLSLLDLGTIRFSKNTYHVNSSGSTFINRYTNDSILINSFNIDTTANRPIWAILPTALSAQFDYNFGNHLYATLSLIQSVTTPRMIGVQRQNTLSIIPRYEFKQFEVSLPFTLQRYQYPQLGIAFRARTFVIGVDNIFPFIMKTNTSALGVYFNVGFSLFKNPKCWNKKPKRIKNKLFSKGTHYNREEKKKVGNVDDSPSDDTPTVKDDKNDGKMKDGKKKDERPEINTKKRYKWFRGRKKNYKESNTTLSINLTSPS